MSIGSGSQSILRRKPITEMVEESGESHLSKSLGLWQLTAIGVGGIIGAGIFALAGRWPTADAPGRPAVLISFLIAGVASAAAALSYAEFAGMIPNAGSAYTYGYAVLGEIVGWFIGWDLLLEYTAIVAVVAIGISGYFGFLVGIGVHLPAWMLGAPGTGDGHVMDLFAVLLCLLIAYPAQPRDPDRGRFETDRGRAEGRVVLLVIVVGLLPHQHRQLHPVLPVRLRSARHRRGHGLLRRLRLRRDEHRGGGVQGRQRHMPKAILYSLAISMVLYVLATLVLTGMQNYRDIDPSAASPPPSPRSGCRAGRRHRRRRLLSAS